MDQYLHVYVSSENSLSFQMDQCLKISPHSISGYISHYDYS